MAFNDKKYLDLSGLQLYDENIKDYVDTHIGPASVAWDQEQESGTKIAEIRINEVSQNVYVPTPPDELADLADDSAHRLVTDTEKSTWNNKSDFDGAYDSLTGKPTLGTAAAKDVAASGDASTTQVVMGNDSRLTDSRPASDVSSWAKASTKPTYTAEEVGLGNVGNYKAVSTVANQGLTTDEQTAARANIGAGTSSFSGSYNDLTNKPTLGTAAAKDVASSGNASTTQVVMGNDTRLTDSRNAKDVYSWAKESTKPSYTASEVGAIATTAKGAANGVAELDSNGKVPSAQLPSFVDDVIEGYYYNGKFYKESSHETEITGETGKIYVDLVTDKTYRWGGSAFVVISETLALGETSTTAYRGDRGKAAYDHSQSTHARTDATAVAASTTNGNIKINGTETTVYTHPGSGTNPHGTTKSDVGLGNVGNFKAVSTVASQGLTDTEKSNARANIGAGTSNLTIGSTSTTAAAGNHTHSISIATDSGTNQLTMASNTKYKITAGGSSYIFTTPVDNNTTYESKAAASGGTAVSLVTTGEKYTWNNKSNLAIGTTATTAAAGNHTHTVTIAADSGTSALNMAANTTYKLTAGGSTFIFKTPADNNSDTKVTQTATSTSANYEVLFSATADNTTRTEGARKNSNLKFNPSTGNLQATQLNGVTIGSSPKFTDSDTKNTAGSTDTSSKIFLIGATSQAANPQTYSHDTAYVGTDGCLYSGGTKVLTAHQDISGKVNKSGDTMTGQLKLASTGFRTSNDNGYSIDEFGNFHQIKAASGANFHIDNTSNVPIFGTEWATGNTFITGNFDAGGNIIAHQYLETRGGDLRLCTSGSSSDDAGDITWFYGNNAEMARIWIEPNNSNRPRYRIFNKSGGNLKYDGWLALMSDICIHHASADTYNKNAVIVTHSAMSSDDTSRNKLYAYGDGNGHPWFMEITYAYSYVACVTMKHDPNFSIGVHYIDSTHFAIITCNWDKVTVYGNFSDFSVASSTTNYTVDTNRSRLPIPDTTIYTNNTVSNVKLKRVGRMVTLILSTDSATLSKGGVTIPYGYRPTDDIYFVGKAFVNNADIWSQGYRVTSGGVLTARSTNNNDGITVTYAAASASYITADDYPSS